MDAFIKDLGFLNWWIGVVIVGIIINLLSAYLKSPTDKILSGFSKWWATRTEKERKARTLRIQKLIDNPDEQIFALIEALHVRVRAVFFALIAGIFGIFIIIGTIYQVHGFSDLLLKIFAVFSALFAFNYFNGAAERLDEITEARRKRSPIVSPP
jgi:hypothetical protein